MKKLPLVLMIITTIASAKPLYGQEQITIKALVGVWQYGSPRIGDQLNQSFVFFSNGDFFFNNGKLGDDLVSTALLKGRYRLNKSKIYFTILSRTITSDSLKIGVVNSSINFGIFEYEDRYNPAKVIVEKNPKEIQDPVNIKVIKPNHIQINDEDYYKVSSNPKDASKL